MRLLSAFGCLHVIPARLPLACVTSLVLANAAAAAAAAAAAHPHSQECNVFHVPHGLEARDAAVVALQGLLCVGFLQFQLAAPPPPPHIHITPSLASHQAARVTGHACLHHPPRLCRRRRPHVVRARALFKRLRRRSSWARRRLQTTFGFDFGLFAKSLPPSLYRLLAVQLTETHI